MIKSTEKVLNQIESIKKNNENNIRNEEQFLNTSPDILEKQKRLNELMNELMTDEMKKTLEELKNMLNNVDKKQLNDLLEKMKMSNKELEEQLDINLSLFKQIEFERKLEETVQSLREQAEKQKKLSEEVLSEKKDLSGQLKEQQEISRKFDSISKSMKELEEKEKELESPPGIEKTEPLQDSIKKNLNKSEEELRSGKPEKSGKSQKESAKQMNKLADQLESMAESDEMDQMAEDASNVRSILESLLRMSFEQEDLIALTNTINRNDPRYQGLIMRQKDLKEKLQSAEDTLLKISKTQFLIGPVILREINTINRSIDEVVKAMNGRNIPVAMAKQQGTMTSLNNLALLLDESLKQMDANMKASKSGKGQKLCKSPSSSGGKMKMKSMRELQEKLSKQLNQMKEGVDREKEKGSMPKKDGQGSMSEQVARLAAEQEALRNQINKYQQELEKEGLKDGGNLSNAMKEMEQNEKDLVNKRITQETIMRQQRIISRLLESEKAEQTRDKEEKRESREEKEQKYRNFTSDFKYNALKTGKNELIQLQAPPVNSYYRNRINDYMLKLGQ